MSWEYFSYDELKCPCCGLMRMDDNFMRRLVLFRHYLNFPFIVTSGYRCPKHNNQVSDTGLYGPHTKGRAIDIHVYGDKAWKFLQAQMFGFTGIGFKQTGFYSTRIIHLDDLETDEIRQRPWVWGY